MSFKIFKQIGNGSIQELIITDLDPAKNYRFKMNAQNNDGTSPWSNTVEWGAIRMDSLSFYSQGHTAITRYSSGHALEGIWVAHIPSLYMTHTPTLVVDHFPLDWSGDLTITPIRRYTIDTGLVGIHTLDPLADLTLYQVLTRAGEAGIVPTLVLKYRNTDSLNHLAPPTLIEIGVSFLADWPHPNPGYRNIPVVYPDTHVDYIVMEDGLLLYKPVGGTAWVARRPDDVWFYPGTFYYNAGADVPLVGITISPYLQNAYPLSTTTERVYYSPTESRYRVSLVAQAWDWMNWTGEIAFDQYISPPIPDAANADWLPDTVQGIMSPFYVIGGEGHIKLLQFYLVSEGATTPVGMIRALIPTLAANPTDPPVYRIVVTRGTDWAGMYVIGQDLFIYGRASAAVEEAPGTPPLLPGPSIVNIHKMGLTVDTGISDYSDVGPNLLTFTPTLALDTFQEAEVLTVGSPANYEGLLVPLSDGSIVIYEFVLIPEPPPPPPIPPTTVVITSPI